MQVELGYALMLAGRLERTGNYPRDEDGVRALAEGLQRAAALTDVQPDRIIQRCGELSQFCPTDADLISVGRDLSRLDAIAKGSYESLSGAGNLARPAASRYRCMLCKDTGWETVWMLHTHEGGASNYVRKQRISEAEAADLGGKIDWKRQIIYTGAKRCACPVPADPKMWAAGDQGSAV